MRVVTFSSSKCIARVWWAPLSVCRHCLELENPLAAKQADAQPCAVLSGVTILPTAPKRVCSFLCQHQALPLGLYLALEHFEQLDITPK